MGGEAVDARTVQKQHGSVVDDASDDVRVLAGKEAIAHLQDGRRGEHAIRDLGDDGNRGVFRVETFQAHPRRDLARRHGVFREHTDQFRDVAVVGSPPPARELEVQTQRPAHTVDHDRGVSAQAAVVAFTDEVADDLLARGGHRPGGARGAGPHGRNRNRTGAVVSEHEIPHAPNILGAGDVAGDSDEGADLVDQPAVDRELHAEITQHGFGSFAAGDDLGKSGVEADALGSQPVSGARLGRRDGLGHLFERDLVRDRQQREAVAPARVDDVVREMPEVHESDDECCDALPGEGGDERIRRIGTVVPHATGEDHVADREES